MAEEFLDINGKRLEAAHGSEDTVPAAVRSKPSFLPPSLGSPAQIQAKQYRQISDGPSALRSAQSPTAPALHPLTAQHLRLVYSAALHPTSSLPKSWDREWAQ